jgi:hypothetical protein
MDASGAWLEPRQLAYRVGDFASFREALLRPLAGEQALAGYAPAPSGSAAGGDLGLQVLEWWAYLADILAFYNERIATESYLGTATRRESLTRLVEVLGYVPRPGIAATGTLAALRRPGSAPDPLVVPAGTPISSTPTATVAAQQFETVTDAVFTGADTLAVTLVPDTPPRPGSVLLAGRTTGVRPGDQLMLLPSGWRGTTDTWTAVTVEQVALEKVPGGGFNTRISYRCDAGTDPGWFFGLDGTGYQVLRAPLSTGWWAYGDASTQLGDIVFHGAPHVAIDETVLKATPGGFGVLGTVPASLLAAEAVNAESVAATTATTATTGAAAGSVAATGPAGPTLAALAGTPPILRYPVLALHGRQLTGHLPTAVRTLTPHQIVVVDDGRFRFPALIGSLTEVIWFLCADGEVRDYPPKDIAPAVPVPHTVLTLVVPPSVTATPLASSSVLRYGAHPVGAVTATPATDTAGRSWPLRVTPQRPAPVGAVTAFLEDAEGAGALVTVTAEEDVLALAPPSGTSAAASPPPLLTAPLRLLLDLVPVTRGTSVAGEVLGGGDARIAGQSFILAKAPLTRLAGGAGYVSTLAVRVNGIAWTEVRSFYGQQPGATVYTTRDLPDGRTEVRFGDGVDGARLPSGSANVIADYRYGSGRSLPPAGRLTTLAQPRPNLAGFVNPVGVVGGADPEPAAALRAAAPADTFAFDRAISAVDYQTVAARTPGVRRAQAVWAWDGGQQRAVVTVYVGDDDAAVDLARAALAAAGDPNRPPTLAAPVPVDLALSCTLRIDPARRADEVLAAARAALLDPETGLFAPGALPIGGDLFRSRLDATLTVPGVVAVEGLSVSAPPGMIAYPAPPSPDVPAPEAGLIEVMPEQSAPHVTMTDRLTPVPGGFFRLAPEAAAITPVVAAT